MVLLALPLSAKDLAKASSDYPFIYYYNESSLWLWPYVFNPTPDDIEPIPLFEIPDEMTVRKRNDVDQKDIEDLINSILPNVQIVWHSYLDPDLCSVTTDSDCLDQAIIIFNEDDRILSARHKYTRKIYMDMKDIYPARKIATYGITDEIKLYYLNEEVVDEANRYLTSKGFEVIPDQYGYNRATVKVSKTTDIISMSNILYESGYFLMAYPTFMSGFKTYSNKSIDKSNLPFLYYDEGGKQYFYELNDRFLVRKVTEIEKSEMESIIKKYLEDCNIIWNDSDFCTVICSPEKVESAISALVLRDEIFRVTHKYMEIVTYEHELTQGVGYPTELGWNGIISIRFKNEVTEAVIDSIINVFDLSLVEYDSRYSSYEFLVPKTADVLIVSNIIYETGLVKYSVPVSYFGNTNDAVVRFIVPTGINETTTNNMHITTENSVLYYNMLGQRMDSPSGLTIVVTHYSDGSVRTEKKWFK